LPERNAHAATLTDALSAAEAGVAHPIVRDAWSCQLS
jgi:hypothetical protein